MGQSGRLVRLPKHYGAPPWRDRGSDHADDHHDVDEHDDAKYRGRGARDRAENPSPNRSCTTDKLPCAPTRQAPRRETIYQPFRPLGA